MKPGLSKRREPRVGLERARLTLGPEMPPIEPRCPDARSWELKAIASPVHSCWGPSPSGGLYVSSFHFYVPLPQLLVRLNSFLCVALRAIPALRMLSVRNSFSYPPKDMLLI